MGVRRFARIPRHDRLAVASHVKPSSGSRHGERAVEGLPPGASMGETEGGEFSEKAI
jgi:hypothetical protein